VAGGALGEDEELKFDDPDSLYFYNTINIEHQQEQSKINPTVGLTKKTKE